MTSSESQSQSEAEFRWAVLAPGRIAHQFADALAAVPGARLQAVWGRDAERARAFARQWQSPSAPAVQVHESVAALLADPSVDAVYIATPHAQHGEFIRAALLAGKPVLCEKPLVPNHAQGLALTGLARERGVFLMEALWTRFLPAYEIAGAWLRDGLIGELRALQSSFCFVGDTDLHSRLWNPDLAGGSLLDIGIYNLAVTRWTMEQALGTCPALERIDAHAVLAETGVDAAITATLHLAGGVCSHFRCGFDAASGNALEIMGTTGAIRFPQMFSQATEVELIRRGQPTQRVAAPMLRNGFEGEIAEAQACIRAGRIESPRMPHAESLALLSWMDAIRKQVGVVYPFEAA
jgi:predicted dehydrogenase